MNSKLTRLLASPLAAPLTLGVWGPEGSRWLERADGTVVTYGELVTIAGYRLALAQAALAELKDKS